MSPSAGSATAVDVSPEIERHRSHVRPQPWVPTMPVSMYCRRATDRVYVLEVNGIPGWQGLQQATGVDVAAAIVEHVERCVQPGTASERPEEPLPA